MARLAAAHFESLANESEAARLGMWIFLSSEILFFGALIMLFFGYRSIYPEEFRAAAHHSIVLIGTVNTYVLITSSAFVALAVAAIRNDRPRTTVWLLGLALALGVVFLGLKAVEYTDHIRDGILPGSAYHYAELPSFGAQLYFTLYYVLTGLHALHVVIGLVLFVWLIRRVQRGQYDATAHLGIELGGLYWHFVDIVWIFLWPMLYLVD